MKEQDLKDKFKIFVNGYVGSSMLTNTEYPEAIELNANKCVQIAKDYAEKEAIEFAEWIVRNCNHSRLRQLDYFELYKEFKNR